MKWIARFFKAWWQMIDEQCPHCGTYCHGKSVFCCPPVDNQRRK